MEFEKEKVLDALLKKALGYDLEETVEEFSIDEQSGKMKKNKKKISKKHLPPDISAMKTLLEFFDSKTAGKYDNMTEEELLREREKLLNMLSQNENNLIENWFCKKATQKIIKKCKKCVKKCYFLQKKEKKWNKN